MKNIENLSEIINDLTDENLEKLKVLVEELEKYNS